MHKNLHIVGRYLDIIGICAAAVILLPGFVVTVGLVAVMMVELFMSVVHIPLPVNVPLFQGIVIGFAGGLAYFPFLMFVWSDIKAQWAIIKKLSVKEPVWPKQSSGPCFPPNCV
jgi:hypothetical protein